MLTLLLFTACNRDKADDTAPQTFPELPTADCGRAPYDWAALEGMGQVVASEWVEDFSLSAGAAASLAGLAGLDDTSALVYDVNVYRVRYTTQDRGVKTEATGLVALPVAAEATPLLYTHPTTGFEDFCAPSGRDLTWAGVPIALAAAGYAVAAPDYLGQNGFGDEATERHPFLVAEATAVASLDSVRALWALAESTDGAPALSRDLLLIGASQGGAAAVWSERYAAAYLPEATLLGSVITVPVLDLVRWAELGATELSAGSVGAGLAMASMNDWYDLSLDVGDFVVPEQKDRLEETMANECPSAELPDDISSLDDLYTQDWMDTLATGDLDAWSPWSCMLAESSVGHAPLDQGAGIPTLMIIGTDDTVALTRAQETAYTALCDEGHAVLALACTGGGHYDTVQNTLDRQLDFLAERAAGEAFDSETCGEILEISCGD